MSTTKKQCANCDQLFDNECVTCPHCKEDDTVPLGDGALTYEDDDWVLFEGEVAKLRRREHQEDSRKELVKLLFSRAMAVRYKQPNRSKDLYCQVVALDPTNWEARIKISWLNIRLGKLSDVVEVLEPVVKSELSTIEQKKRAYNNICCAFLFGKPVDFNSALLYAKKGIEVDGVGTDKLWENYATILIHQYHYAEAIEALTKAVLLEPNSIFAQKKLVEVEKLLKTQNKKAKKGKKMNKENLENNFEIISRKSTSKTMLTKKTSKKELVQFC